MASKTCLKQVLFSAPSANVESRKVTKWLGQNTQFKLLFLSVYSA